MTDHTSALQIMLAAAAAEEATEQTVLDAIAPFVPEDADTGRLRVLARGFIKDAGIARHRAEQMQKHLTVALAGYPHNLGPAPVIVDAAPFIDRPSVFTRKDAA